jgi:hypothetical protein
MFPSPPQAFKEKMDEVKAFLENKTIPLVLKRQVKVRVVFVFVVCC